MHPARPLRRINFSPCVLQTVGVRAESAMHRSPFLAYPRPFTTTSQLCKKAVALPPRPTLPDSDLRHSYVKGSGPGGQKINKTNSAAQLTHLPTGIVVKSQATRSRSQNHMIAKRILAEKVEWLEMGDESRRAKVHERATKRKKSAEKKRRRKYRRLAGEEGGGDKDEEEERDEAEIEIDTEQGEREQGIHDGENEVQCNPRGSDAGQG